MKLSQKQLEGLLSNTRLDFKGKNLYADCPWCGYNEFGISLDDNHVFNCFRKKHCGYTGNIFSLLKKLGKVKEFLSDREIDVFERLESNLGVEEDVAIDLDLPEIKPPLLWKRVEDDEYLRERGFEEYQFEKFEVGRSKFKPEYITFLVRMDGKLVGYISRSCKSKEWIDAYNERKKAEGSQEKYLRYDNSASDFGKMLFGYDEIVEGETDTVILTEGIFSKTKTDSNLDLDFQDQIKCCSTFGAKFSEHQIELLKLKKVKNLIFWFEADVLDKIKVIVSRAALYFNVKVSYLQGKDPNDIDQDGAFELLEQSKDWLDFNISYLNSNL